MTKLVAAASDAVLILIVILMRAERAEDVILMRAERAEDLLVSVIRLATDVQRWRIVRIAPRYYPTGFPTPNIDRRAG